MDLLASLLIFPVAIVHFWFHALLPTWRKHPVSFYLFAALIWGITWVGLRNFAPHSVDLFSPTEPWAMIGKGLKILGLVMAVSSLATLGIRRFFLWAVLRPDSVPKIRFTKGPFAFVPHPAYFGYILIAIGDVMGTGETYSMITVFVLLALTPLMIWLEEEELRKRLGK